MGSTYVVIAHESPQSCRLIGRPDVCLLIAVQAPHEPDMTTDTSKQHIRQHRTHISMSADTTSTTTMMANVDAKVLG
jgi:hypothetical protein